MVLMMAIIITTRAMGRNTAMTTYHPAKDKPNTEAGKTKNITIR
jgi:hypothetical protein